MKKFAALLSISFKSMLLSTSGFGSGKRKRKAFSGLGAMAAIAILALYISGIYSYALLDVLAPIGMESLLFIFMGIAALISGLMFTAFAVKNTVFGGKDNDLLLSMPVSSTMLMGSRVAAIYAENLLFSFFLLMPAGAVCMLVSQNGVGQSVGFWLRMLIAVFSLPLLDTALSVLLGACVAWLSTKMTKKAIGQNLVMGLYLVVVFWFAFNVNSMIASLTVSAGEVKSALSWAKPVIWMADGIMGSWGSIVDFAIVCIAPFVLVVLGLGKVYRKAVTAFGARSARSDYKLSGQRFSGQRRALMLKEAQRFFGTPIYFWNSALGFLMLIVGGIFLLIKIDDIAPYMQLLGDQTILLLIAMAIAGFCLSTGMVSAPSISLEGKNLWILREAPMSERMLISIKTNFQMLVALPCILICMICVILSGALSLERCLILTVFSLLFEVGHANFGMLMGLVFARLDASNESAVIKRSMLAYLSIFAPMAILGVAALLGWALSLLFPQTAPQLILLTMSAVTAVFTVVSVLELNRHGVALVKKLSE